MLLVEFKHFDWWGGWSYGYRHLVDPAALMVLLLIPIIPWICRDRWRFIAYLVLLFWSIVVQAIGARGQDARFIPTVDAIVAHLARELREGDRVVVLSNGGFGGIHGKLLTALAAPAPVSR